MSIILIQGGARSGKSTFGEMMAEKIGGMDVIYLASGVATDSEMKARIKNIKHSVLQLGKQKKKLMLLVHI